MKLTKLATLSLAILLYATAALAEHGHSGGAAGGGTGMGAAMGHGTGLSDHSNGNAGNANSGSSGSTHKASVNDILKKNPAIGDKIHALTGMSAQDACAGFKNLGQCVAAAHVSKNLGISFDCLKSDMTGTAPQGSSCPAGTGTKGMSLGKAIQTLDPHADQKSESKKGEAAAQHDLKNSGVQS